MTRRLGKTAWILALLVVVQAGVRAAPDPNWSTQFTITDCFGAAQQSTGACDDYAADLYEHLDYSNPQQAATADVQVHRNGYDADYYYFEMDFVADWDVNHSTGHQVVLELDGDADTETGRGDYYIGIFQKSEFNSTSWVDAYDQGGYDLFEDPNNDVGGNNPSASDFGGSSGDGYDNAISQASDNVWARVVNGNFEVALKRSVIGSPAKLLVRSWSRQSTSLAPDKLYFHDQNAITDVSQVDNLRGLPGDSWAPVGPGFILPLVKRAFESDGTPIPSGTTLSKGVPVKFMIYINNTTSGSAADITVQDILDPEFAYQAGSIKVDNTQPCAADPCTVGEEATVFSNVDDNAALTDAAAAGDVASFDGTDTVDLGDGNEVNNDQLDINASSVWVVLFTVKMQ